MVSEVNTIDDLDGNYKHVNKRKKLRDVMNRILGRNKFKKPGKEKDGKG